MSMTEDFSLTPWMGFLKAVQGREWMSRDLGLLFLCRVFYFPLEEGPCFLFFYSECFKLFPIFPSPFQILFLLHLQSMCWHSTIPLPPFSHFYQILCRKFILLSVKCRIHFGYALLLFKVGFIITVFPATLTTQTYTLSHTRSPSLPDQ